VYDYIFKIFEKLMFQIKYTFVKVVLPKFCIQMFVFYIISFSTTNLIKVLDFSITIIIISTLIVISLKFSVGFFLLLSLLLWLSFLQKFNTMETMFQLHQPHLDIKFISYFSPKPVIFFYQNSLSMTRCGMTMSASSFPAPSLSIGYFSLQFVDGIFF